MDNNELYNLIKDIKFKKDITTTMRNKSKSLGFTKIDDAFIHFGLDVPKRKPKDLDKQSLEILKARIIEGHEKGWSLSVMYVKCRKHLKRLGYTHINEVCEKLGMETFNKKTERPRPRKYTKEEVSEAIKYIISEKIIEKLPNGSYSLAPKEYKWIYHYSNVYFGNWTTALKELGFEHTVLTKEDIANLIKKDRGVHISTKDYHSQVEKYFGNISNALEELGQIRYHLYTKLETHKLVYEFLQSHKGVKITKRTLRDWDEWGDLLYSMEYYHGDIMKYFTETIFNINYFEYILPHRWTKDKVAYQFNLMFQTGEDLRYNTLRNNHEQFFINIRKFFGSVRGLYEFFNMDYDAIIEERSTSENYNHGSYLLGKIGIEFEEILDEVIMLGFPDVDKYHHDHYNPDYVMGNVWADAKTTFSSNTLDVRRRYLACEECEMLIFIVLMHEGKRINKKDYAIVSPEFYANQIPHEELKNHYINEFARLRKEYSKVYNEYFKDAV